MRLTAGNTKSLFVCAGLALASMGWSCAQRASAATTIDFTSQNGASGSVFQKDKQAQFVVTPTAGVWQVSQNFGNPVPSIYDSLSSSATITVTESGSLFTFKSLDQSSENGSAGFVITGTDSGVTEFTETGNFAADTSPFSFSTYSASKGDAKADVDTLTITIDPASANDPVFLDNIKVAGSTASVPEPTTACVLLGAGGLMLLRGKRSKIADNQ